MPETPAAADPWPDDATLLARFKQEPVRWLPAVLGRYEAPLLRHASSVLADAGLAQDVVQECFLKLIANGQPIQNLSAWLHRVTHNLAVDQLRDEARRQRLHAAASEARVPLPSVEGELLGREKASLLERAMEGLTPNERAVLHLKLKAGKSYREISAITGLSSGNVGYLIHQAVKKLAARLKAAGAREGAS